MRRKFKDVCKRGHPLTGDNLRYDCHRNRYCKACAQRREKRRWEQSVARRKRTPAPITETPHAHLYRQELTRVMKKHEERKQRIHEQMERVRETWTDLSAKDLGFMRRGL